MLSSAKTHTRVYWKHEVKVRKKHKTKHKLKHGDALGFEEDWFLLLLV